MVLDTHSVHVAAGVPASTNRHDPAKRVPGRKRGLAVDVLGLVIAVVVLAANAHDHAAGIVLPDQVWDLTVHEVARNVHAHPTLGEAVKEAVHGLADT